MVVSPAVSTLCENSNEVFLNVAKLLLTYADNILRYPNEEKYRSIRIGNPTFSTKLLPIKGAVECLFEMGFAEAETHLVFPSSASVEQLKIVREAISIERNQRLSGQQPLQSPQTASSSSSALQLPPVANPTNTQSPSQESSLESSMGFFVTLQSNFQHVMVYEDPALQQKAKSHMPLEQLSSAASEKLKQAAEVDPDCTLGLEDFLVHELLSWFKKDFFSWVNCLPCEVCGGETQTSRALNPTADDKRWGARHVESHYCTACQVPTRFPRYNSPEKLLETRRGRCGEWANCFTLCCRAVGLEARYIWDSTDHVWTEIYSVSQRRWIHCDPCENVCDKPLLYEVGWGKKLAYVVAFSKDQVVDVTWRYSCKHPEVLKRRNTVQETWLRRTITGFSTVRQQSMSPARKKELTDRLLVELVEFLSPKTPKQGDLGGRNSGSLAWRIARGETGDAPSGTSNAVDECVFQPTEKERNERLIHLRYSATSDQYCRVSNSSEVLVGWQQGVWKAQSVFRKVETDWQMVYIARTEGSSTGRVAWKFDFAQAGMKMKALSIRATSQTFHSGQVLWRLRADQMTTEFAGDGKMQSFPGLSGSSQLVVEVELTGGDGESSWQHSQLFRQSLRETEESSFEIQIELEDA